MSAGWGALGFSRMARARKMGYSAADYFGVYAVEGNEILSAVRVIKVPFTTPNGVERIVGIQGVVTRRDQGRTGLARNLLEEVHRREKGAGTKFALLWTGRGQVAHNLYEKLGYVDVYTPELAVGRTSKNPVTSNGYRMRKARSTDFGLIEKLHTEGTKGRPGFTPRPAKVIELAIRLGFAGLDTLRIITKNRRPVGYAQVERILGWPRLEELLLLPEAEPEAVLSLLEAEAHGGWYALRNTAVREHLDLLRRRGYSTSNLAYYSLLAKPLDRENHDMTKELGATSRRFTCQAFDYF